MSQKKLLDVGNSPFLFIWLVIGGFGLLYLASDLLEGFRFGAESKNWPTTEGTITVSNVLEGEYGEDFAVRYRYSVNNHTYTNDDVTYGPSNLPNEARSDLLAYYPVGKAVTIYYRPEDPQTAVLAPGPPDVGPSLFSIIFIIIFGGVWLIFLVRSAKSVFDWLMKRVRPEKVATMG